MSQKAGKRSRRSTTDSDSGSQFKLPSAKNINNNKEIKEDEINKENEEISQCSEINGNNETTSTTATTTVEMEITERVTRSRSSTPQIKQINGQEDSDKPIEQTSSQQTIQLHEEIIIEEIDVNTEEKLNEDKEEWEMDPLVLDENDPELLFDDTSDHDGGSGKSSPALNRCATRRSQTRNIPTPKTPPQQLLQQKEEIEDGDEEETEEDDAASSIAPPSSSCISSGGDRGRGSGGGGGGGDDLSSTFETCDNLSTKAETGSDTTRFNYLINNTTITTSEPSTFLLESKDRSFTETLRGLSSRRSIRPLYDYRRRIFNKIDKNDLNSSAPSHYPSRRESIERVSIGNKRKIVDEHDTTTLKRFKLDTSGLWTKLTSPLTNIKGSFKRSDLPSSTPKLTGYKDEKLFVEDGNNNGRDQNVDVNEKRWCIIM